MERKLSRKELKGKGTELKATMHVGKDGASEGVVEELVNQLKANKLVKVKVLASSSEQKREIAEELASRSGAVLIEVRGNTILLCDGRYVE
ncbi:MAG: YhbY family RNA-binding protein [Methanomassiliicoccales archaeon]|jgi:RNA-binding protein|nr:YhbY family RNA-binding protein [Methanomassiliicoccales archaeon]